MPLQHCVTPHSVPARILVGAACALKLSHAITHTHTQCVHGWYLKSSSLQLTSGLFALCNNDEGLSTIYVLWWLYIFHKVVAAALVVSAALRGMIWLVWCGRKVEMKFYRCVLRLRWIRYFRGVDFSPLPLNIECWFRTTQVCKN